MGRCEWGPSAITLAVETGEPKVATDNATEVGGVGVGKRCGWVEGIQEGVDKELRPGWVRARGRAPCPEGSRQRSRRFAC